MSDFTREEIEAVHDRYLETRNEIEAGKLPWSALAEHFVEDCTFVDPAWGRMEGIAKVREFLDTSMKGLEDWSFPHQWRMVEGNRIVAAWMNRLPGRRDDGTFYEALGISILEYAGEGKLRSEVDLLNMVHVLELVAESGWIPGPEVTMPPQRPPR